VLLLKLTRKSSPGNITRAQEFQRLYFLLGVASEAGTEEIAKNIELGWSNGL
jgi:hypothetical protein